MGRTLRCSLAGAGVGFLVGFGAVCMMMPAAQPASDTGSVLLFVGSFLAGTGAIAGAVIGGVADLQEFVMTKDQTPRGAQDRDKSESGDAVA